MTEGIYTIVVLLFKSHVLTDFTDAIVDIRAETVRVAIALMKVEQVLILSIIQILVESRLDVWFNSHFDIRFISSAMASLCSFIADYAIVVIRLL